MISTQPSFIVVKQFGRLSIADGDRLVYTPPSFIVVPDRAALAELAEKFSKKGSRDIVAIMEFEAKWHPKKHLRALATT